MFFIRFNSETQWMIQDPAVFQLEKIQLGLLLKHDATQCNGFVVQCQGKHPFTLVCRSVGIPEKEIQKVQGMHGCYALFVALSKTYDEAMLQREIS